MRNPDRPFGSPTTPADIIATAHRAAPYVWRKRVGENRRQAAVEAVRGALSMQRNRTIRACCRRRLSPPYTDAERTLLKDAWKRIMVMRWILFFFNPEDAGRRAFNKRETKAALLTLDALVECEREVDIASAREST